MPSRDEVPVPLYYRIREDLRELIDSGQLKPGDQLSSERELSKQYGVSSITVKRGVLDLVRDGLLYRVPGKGTFVSQPKMERDLSRLTSFTEEMLHHGLKPNSRVLEARIIPASGSVAKNLDLPPGEKIIALERLRFANGEPLMLEKTFLPHRLFPDLLSEDLATQSLYHFITVRYGVSLAKARETLEPVIINDKEAHNLAVEAGAPGLLLELVAYTDNGRPVEYTKAIVRGDRCKYYIEMAGFRRERDRSGT
ncbi:MAG TPA: GntR family transcriptional regulator [Chloroflexi bacterium]|nr:GntR family transcriptional regulator [Chloroflexota bacterium]